MRTATLCRLGGIAAFVLLSAAWVSAEEEPIFSGPQPGEKLPGFKVRGVFGEEAGRELDFVERAGGKPLVLLFVHEVNRPTVMFMRAVTKYVVSRPPEELQCGVVWLHADPTEAEAEVKRIAHALTLEAPLGISLDGREGPGSYGLNRHVALTVLVAKEGKVTANFALVQPSAQSDLPKVLEAIVATAGGEVPPLERLTGMPAAGGAPQEPAPIPELRSLLGPVIRKEASNEEVDRAAAAVEAAAADDQRVRREVGGIARRIIESGRLEQYGTPRAREHLRRWAAEFVPAGKQPAPERGEARP